MARTLKLLLTENVDNLGIVGDVVGVRLGYARNFLLPRNLATTPSEEALKAVAAKRAEAERMLAVQRKEREETIGKMQGVEITLTRSCNDQGVLYGAITQQDIAAALGEAGYGVKPRDVRLGQVIKRVDTYDVQIKLDSDLATTVKLWVVADRKLDLDAEREEMEFDNEGNLIEKPRGEKRKRRDEEAPEGGDQAGADAKPEKARRDKGERAEKSEKGDKPDRAAKGEKAEKGDKGEKGPRGAGAKAEKGDKSAKAEAAEKAAASKPGTFGLKSTPEMAAEYARKPRGKR